MIVEIELALLILGVVGLAVACWRGTDKLTGAVYDRQKAMDQVFKETSRHDLRAAREAEKTLEHAKGLHDDSRQLLERVERHVRGK